MKRAVTCLLMGACLGSALAESVGQVRTRVAANYAEIAKAFVAKDFGRFGNYMTDDFTAIPPGGHAVARAEVVKDFTEQRGRLSEVKWKKKIKKITLDGNTAHLVVDGRMDAKVLGADGKPHAFLLTASSEDDWVGSAGVWKLKLSKTTVFQMKIDGKPVNFH